MLRLRPDAFYVPAHRMLYELIQEFWDKTKPIDFVSLKQALKDRNQLEEIGGPEYLNELYTFIPTAVNADYYVEIVREKHARRQMILTCNRLATQCYDQQEGEVEPLLKEAEKAISSIRQGYLDSPQLKPTWFDGLAIAACTSASLRGLEPDPRDPIVDGWFLQGDLGFIFAARGVGKSWFGINLARSIAQPTHFGPWKVHSPKKVMYLDGDESQARAMVDVHTTSRNVRRTFSPRG
jgi:replicative DNA helicase